MSNQGDFNSASALNDVPGPQALGFRRPWLKRCASFFRPLGRSDWPFILLLGLAVACTWFATYRLWPWELATPFEYSQDAMYQLGAMSAAADRGVTALWGGVDPRLGAPFGARWSDFPISEDAMYLGVGLLSRALGPVAGLNVAYLITCVLSALSLYFVGRTLRLSRQGAAFAGALFAMAPYVYWRNLHHFNLTVYWPVPLVFLLWLWAGSRNAGRLGTRRFAWSVGSAVLLAIHNNYYFNYACQVLVLLLVLQGFRRRWKAVKSIAIVLAAGAAAFLLVNADTLISMATLGRNTEAVNRSIEDTVRFGLRPMELWIPSPLHRIDAFARFGANYRGSGTGEFPSMFLGVIGGLALVLLLIHAMMSLFGQRRPGLAGRFGVMCGWLALLAVPGGVMHAIQTVVGFTAFRSNNRVSLMILGLSLLYAARLIDARWKSRGMRATIFACLSVFGLWEQSVDLSKLSFPGGQSYADYRRQLAAMNSSDIAFGAVLERQLPPNASLMQFPPLAFPEGGGAAGLSDYEHFRVYIHTRTLRFSYGSMKGRPEASYSFRVYAMTGADAMHELSDRGFKGAVFKVGGIPFAQVQAWAASAATVKPNRIVTSDLGDWAAVLWD